MFVTAIDFWPNGKQQRVEDPTWDFVDARLRLLDGEVNDGVLMDSGGDSYMGISGGEHGRYIVAGYLDGFGSYICASGKVGGALLEVVVTADYNTYESKHVVGIETVISAAKEFFERGVLSEELNWEKQESGHW